jgi:hypothetical protein
VFGDAEAVVDRAIAGGGIQPRRGAHVVSGHSGDRFHGFRRIQRLRDEGAPLVKGRDFAALAHEVLFDQALGDDHVRQGVDQRDVGAGAQFQVLLGRDVRRAHEVDAPRIGDDELGPLTQAPLHLRSEYRVAVGGVCADDENHVGFHHRIEVLRAGGLAQRIFQSITGGRVADARTSVDIVVAEAGAN